MKNINKKDSPCVLKKTVVFGILLLIIFCAILASETSTKAADDVEWELKLEFKEPGGVNGYVVFGEATNATDGPPHDDYDMPRPPNPQPPYILPFFYDNMHPQYHVLFGDYRTYSDTYKVWNLTVQWNPVDDNSTTITIYWDNNNITNIEYYSVELFKVGDSDHVSDMLINTEYSFLCPANEAQHFQIICQGGTSNGKTDTNEISLLYYILIFVLIIICLLILYWKIIRR